LPRSSFSALPLRRRVEGARSPADAGLPGTHHHRVARRAAVERTFQWWLFGWPVHLRRSGKRAVGWRRRGDSHQQWCRRRHACLDSKEKNATRPFNRAHLC
jgi:hypothetical protein